jgi:deazaflavin-dependent oxidoreductase (nitroreductase family)
MNAWNDRVIEEFLAGKERIADTFDRSNLMLLHTTGARSGQPRTSPVAYQPDGDRMLIVASAAGRDQHPAWYHNLVTHPTVSVQRWTQDGVLERFDATATVEQGAERDRLFERIVQVMPGFGDYQRKTARVIPVISLRRV